MTEIGYLSLKLDADVAAFVRNLGEAVNKMGETENKILESVNKMAEGVGDKLGEMVAEFVAFEKLKEAVEKVIDASKEAETATARVQGLLAATGNAAGVTEGKINELAEKYSKLSGVKADVIKEAEAMLLTFDKIGKNTFPLATKAVMDVSAALGTDLKTAALQVGRALEDPEKGIQRLARAHIVLSAEQAKYIKNLQESGHLEKARVALLDDIEARVGGMSARMRDTLEGAFTALDTAWTEFNKDLGDLGPMNIMRNGVEGMIIVVTEWDEALKKSAVKEYFNELGVAWKAFVDGPARWLINSLLGVADALGMIVKYGSSITLTGFSSMAAAAGGKWDVAKDLANKERGMISEWANQKGGRDYVGEFEKFGKDVSDTRYSLAAKHAQELMGRGAPGEDAVTSKASKEAEKEQKRYQDLLRSLDEEIVKKKAILDVDRQGELTAEATQKVGKLFATDTKAHAEAVAQVAARMKELSNIQSGIKRDEIIESLQKELDKKTAIAEKDNAWLLTLEAQAKVEKLFPHDAELRNQALQRVKETLVEISNKESIAKRDELLKSYDNELIKKKALADADGAALIQLEAKEKVEKLFPYDDKQRADALEQVRQKLAALHEFESEEAWKKKLESLKEQNDALQAKVNGTEKQFELEKKILEIEKDPYLSAQKKLEMAGAISQENDRTEKLNKLLEEQKTALGDLSKADMSYKDKLDELNKAFKDQALTLDQYNTALNKLNNQTLTTAQKKVHDFTASLVNGITGAVTGGQKLTDVIKGWGVQLAQLGIQKFLVDPLANAASNWAKGFLQNNVLPGAQGQLASGGGIAGWLARQIYGTNAPGAAAGAAGTGSAVAGSGAGPSVANSQNTPQIGLLDPAIKGIGVPTGSTAQSAASTFLDNLTRIASTLDLIKVPTPEGEAWRVKIAFVPDPAAHADGPLPKNKEVEDNVVPFLKTIVGDSKAGPAWRVIEPDCPCPGGNNVIPFPKSNPAAGAKDASASTSASGDINVTPDSLQPLTALLGLAGIAGIMKALKGLDSVNLTGLMKSTNDIAFNTGNTGALNKTASDILDQLKKINSPNSPGGSTSSISNVETLLRYVMEWPKRALRVTNVDGCCGEAGSGSGSSGGAPYAGKPNGAGTAGRNPFLVGGVSGNTFLGGGVDVGNMLSGLASGFGGGPGGYTPMTPMYDTGGGGLSLMGGADLFNASGGYSAFGSVSGQLLPYAGAPNNNTAVANAIAAATQPGTNGKGFNPYTQLASGGASGNKYLSSQQTQLYLKGLADQSNRNLTAGYQAGNVSYAQLQNYQGAWSNALATQAAQGYSATPNWLKGLNGGSFEFAGGTGILGTQVNEIEDPSFTPGFTGGIRKAANASVYNGGDFSTQLGGMLGPYATRDAWSAYIPGALPMRFDEGGIVDQGKNFSYPTQPSYNPSRFKPGQGGILGYAEGGDPPVGVPSWVGERGRELFVPKQPGTVVSNDKVAQILQGQGSSTPNVQIINHGHPIEHQSAEWDGNTLKAVVGNIIAQAPNDPRYKRNAQRRPPRRG